MNFQFLLPLIALAFVGPCIGADFPRIASLKPDETVKVSMRLYGVAITGADFLFAPDKVTVKPLRTKGGDIVLTQEEKTRIDEYFVMIRNGERRHPDEEGFKYSIKFYRAEQEVGSWSYQIYDAKESAKPNLSLYELKDRMEKQKKDAELAVPSEGGNPSK